MRKMILAALVATTLCETGYAAVYTDQSSFTAATTGSTAYTFPVFAGGSITSGTYSLGPVSFSVPGTVFGNGLYGYNDSTYGGSYISDANAAGGADNVFNITSSTSALGLFLGSYHGEASYSYLLGDGTIGSVMVTGSGVTFIGFTSISGPLSVSFAVGHTSPNDELDIPSFISADAVASPAPEPASWAMMIAGFGLIGVAMRRRKVAVSFA